MEVGIESTGLKLSRVDDDESQDDEENTGKSVFCVFQALIAGVLPDRDGVNPADYISPQPSAEESNGVLDEVRGEVEKRQRAQRAKEMLDAGPPQRGGKRR
jgi:hypothetical protein